MTLCVLADSAAVIMLAVPLLRTTAGPTLEPSTWNWTEPVGGPLARAAALMVAVEVTAWAQIGPEGWASGRAGGVAIGSLRWTGVVARLLMAVPDGRPAFGGTR